MPGKSSIISKLEKEILPLHGIRSQPFKIGEGNFLGPITQAFPLQSFPLGAIHEFMAESKESMVASSGFITGILSKLMRKDAVSVWISAGKPLYPPGLVYFGIRPERILFLHDLDKKQMIWATEEALKCEGLTAVVSELADMDFLQSRRFQLAVESSKVTGFIIRYKPRIQNITASVTRWKITHLASRLENDLPGVGFPAWNIELLKVRNGTSGSWQMEFRDNAFTEILPGLSFHLDQLSSKRKTG